MKILKDKYGNYWVRLGQDFVKVNEHDISKIETIEAKRLLLIK